MPGYRPGMRLSGLLVGGLPVGDEESCSGSGTRRGRPRIAARDGKLLAVASDDVENARRAAVARIDRVDVEHRSTRVVTFDARLNSLIVGAVGRGRHGKTGECVGATGDRAGVGRTRGRAIDGRGGTVSRQAEPVA